MLIRDVPPLLQNVSLVKHAILCPATGCPQTLANGKTILQKNLCRGRFFTMIISTLNHRLPRGKLERTLKALQPVWKRHMRVFLNFIPVNICQWIKRDFFSFQKKNWDIFQIQKSQEKQLSKLCKVIKVVLGEPITKIILKSTQNLLNFYLLFL